jgi:hypothetical protein
MAASLAAMAPELGDWLKTLLAAGLQFERGAAWPNPTRC